jgi:tetratricopeptide (TPR) repeat protein
LGTTDEKNAEAMTRRGLSPSAACGAKPCRAPLIQKEIDGTAGGPPYFSDYSIAAALGASGSAVVNASGRTMVGVTAIKDRPMQGSSEDPQTQIARMSQLAGYLYQQGRHSEAISLATQTCHIARGVLGVDHPYHATCLNQLAELYHMLGDYPESERVLRQAVDIYRRVQGASHPDYGTSLFNLAVLYHEMSQYATAAPLYRQSLEVLRPALGMNHPTVATILNNLALLYATRGDYAAAEPLYLELLTI